jgi:hypothetical protein
VAKHPSRWRPVTHLLPQTFTIMTPVDHGRDTAITLSHFGVVLGTIGNNLAKPGPVAVVNHFHPLRQPEPLPASETARIAGDVRANPAFR